ncbi:trichohyalin-like [Salvelinus fontinalis]|uniref:trichohyalin-like n=1 Tax=Salvelinus fontinalis TaxID=8038 RepID=UPI002486A2E9|nr:trichohyalin-like [Salvelinus fontinalis]
MSSWVWVQLLALLASCLRSGSAEGDPLPPGLVELVRSNPISSIEDLQLLLLSDSVDEDFSDDFLPSGQHSNNTSNRLPRSLDAQPAQQALCKVRTEVMEVTRAMLDRSNADFMLWPPCVEVQRCSGCCNTKSLQCVPVLTHTRHLQVMKIQYVDKRPNYSKAVVSVHDHVECRCQPAPRPPAVPKKKSTPRREQKDNKGEGHPAKARSKEELHRRDELKHNQRIQLEDLLDQHWNPKDTSSDAGERKGGYGLDHDKMDPQWLLNATRQLGANEWTERRHHGDMEEGRDSSSVNGTTTAMNIDMAQLDHEKRDGVETRGDSLFNITEGNASRGDRQQGSLSLSEEEGDQETQRQPTQTQSPSLRTNTSKQQRHGTNSSSEETKSREGANQRTEQRFHPTEETNQRPESRFPPLEEADQRRKDNETPDSERSLQHALQLEQEKLEEERKELLLLHRRLDDEKELLRREQQKQQQQEKEEQQYHRPNHKHQTQTTTQRTDTVSPTSTRAPSVLAGPRPPARPGPPRKRMRKNNRKRISKAAMRAMLM